MPYICPICQSPLSLHSSLTTQSWHCATGHQFDCAKEGYVNLLPVQKKKTKDPGDNKDMMLARREFLNKGYYQALSDEIIRLAQVYAPDSSNILDIGCGEGYYSHRLFDAIKQDETDSHITLHGLDISKSAIRYAAKRYPQISFCVASVFEMPFGNNSFDLAIRIYVPSQAQELQRVMKPGGILIAVSPGPKHHYALKQKIYPFPKLHSDEPLLIEGFEYAAQHRLEYMLSLDDKTDIGHFLNMTPYAWKLSDIQKQEMADFGLNCELDFKIEIYKKHS